MFLSSRRVETWTWWPPERSVFDLRSRSHEGHMFTQVGNVAYQSMRLDKTYRLFAICRAGAWALTLTTQCIWTVPLRMRTVSRIWRARNHCKRAPGLVQRQLTKMNEGKTAFKLVGSVQNLKKSANFNFKIGGSTVLPSEKVEVLGVIIDSKLT